MAGSTISVRNFEGTATLARAGRCIMTGAKYINTDSAARFCQVFDAAAAADVTVGTTAPTWIFSAGGSGGDDDYVGDGISFVNGIVVAATTTPLGSTGAADDTAHVWFIIE